MFSGKRKGAQKAAGMLQGENSFFISTVCPDMTFHGAHCSVSR